MNRKFLILLIAITVFSITAVSAFELSDLLGEENQTVQIDGIDFNIPAGFEEDASQESINEDKSSSGIDYIINGKTFIKDGTVVSIIVADYGEYKVTDDVLSAVGENKTTINDVDGYISYDGGFYIFNYAKNDKMIIITSDVEDVIGDFVIA